MLITSEQVLTLYSPTTAGAPGAPTREGKPTMQETNTREVPTYCRICEPQCGLIATVEDGRLVRVRGDESHPHSQGFRCVKSQAAVDIAYDPDRILHPLRRIGGPGEFERVSWDEALDDIAARLRRLWRQHGTDALALFFGNPPAFGYAAALALGGFQSAMKIKWRYGVNADDSAARLVADALLYGTVATHPKPDLWRTQCALLIGTNPLISHGSLITEARFKDALDSIVERGGRVLVVDPRRSETARRYEHVPIRAGNDPYFLLGILNVVIAEDLVDRVSLARNTIGFETFAELVAPYTPEYCEQHCQVPAAVIRDIAHTFASSPSAVVYGRTGTCTQRFGTLNNLLQDILTIITGNVEREGGLIFGGSPLNLSKFADVSGMATFGSIQARTTGMPEVFGMLPSTSLPTDITEPGHGQVHGLFMIGGNPMLSGPAGGPQLQAALERLDVHIAVDLYVNETNKYADYVLPCVGQYEREDFPLAPIASMLRPAIWATDQVIAPRGEARNEFDILDEIARRSGRGGAYSVAPLRWLAKANIRVKPRTLIDVLIRTSSAGDLYGLRRNGVSFGKLLRRYPHGKALRPDLPVGRLADFLRTPAKKIALAPTELVSELRRLDATDGAPAQFPLRLHGLRESRSQNTWMHNVLAPNRKTFAAFMNPQDAASAGVRDGDRVKVISASGSLTVAVRLTDDISPGNFAMPHGWGHAGGWRKANTYAGVNSNILASAAPADIEALAGMSILNGIPVRVEKTRP